MGKYPRTNLDFRPFEIVSAAFSEYRARILLIIANCSPRARGIHACKLGAVIKHDIGYCDHECGVVQDRLGMQSPKNGYGL